MGGFNVDIGIEVNFKLCWNSPSRDLPLPLEQKELKKLFVSRVSNEPQLFLIKNVTLKYELRVGLTRGRGVSN